MVKSTSQDAQTFLKQLTVYKKLIDEDIAQYSKQLRRQILQDYGTHSRVAVDAYLDVLSRGGKRIRGALTMLGYEMSGGSDRDMILQAARAVEMIQAYVLIVDDINDRSIMRRGGKAAHIRMAEYYNDQELGHDSQHFGESIAMNAALAGNHAAQVTMASLSVSEVTRLAAMNILNRGMLVTVHGQFNDIFNEVTNKATEQDVYNVTEWKTAHYTFLNPLHIGMTLAGAQQSVLDTVREYAINIGHAFQIVDDILGTFGGEFETGKSPLDDTREGKRTLLSIYALEKANPSDKNFLVQMLGNQNLTRAEFERCQEIIQSTGALDYSRQKADDYVSVALDSLEKAKQDWSSEGTQFLRGLAEYLLVRTS